MIIKSVTNLMIKESDIITVSQDKSLIETKELMKKHNIHGIPVVKRKKLIGIITLKDIQD